MGLNPRDYDKVIFYRGAMKRAVEIEPHWPAWKREIAERLNELGLSMKEASIRSGLGETWVRDALKRDKEPIHKNITKLKVVLGIGDSSNELRNSVQNLPVIGRAQAGAFLDVSVLSQDHDYETIPVAKSGRFPHAEQYALEVIGDSMNKLFDQGSFVTCVDWAGTGMSLRPGMCLHVERYQGSLVEVTLKCFDLVDGKPMLCPRSSNPSHKPIPLAAIEEGEIHVRGLVIGVWKPLEF